MTSVNNAVNNLIYTIEAAGLSLATKVDIKMWVKGTLKSILDLVFTSP